MQVALINTNRMQPPVAPIALDYLAEALHRGRACGAAARSVLGRGPGVGHRAVLQEFRVRARRDDAAKHGRLRIYQRTILPSGIRRTGADGPRKFRCADCAGRCGFLGNAGTGPRLVGRGFRYLGRRGICSARARGAPGRKVRRIRICPAWSGAKTGRGSAIRPPGGR